MKRLIYSRLLCRTKLLRLWQSLRAKKMTILTIHSVLDQIDSWEPVRTYLPASKLRAHLKELTKAHTLISLTDAIQIVKGERAPVRNGLVLTLDDGYRNNFTVAYPLFKEFNAPATFFVVPEQINTQRPFWFDRFDYALQKNAEIGTVVRLPNGEERTVEGTSRSYLNGFLVGTFKRMMHLYQDDYELTRVVEPVIEALEELQGHSLLSVFDENDPAAIVDWETLDRVANDPLVTIGCHTLTHSRLPGLTAENLIRETQQPMDRLLAYSKTNELAFCFPNGSHDERTAQAVDRAGYSCGLTTVDGMIERGDNPFQLNRINTPVQATPEELLVLASGAYPG